MSQIKQQNEIVQERFVPVGLIFLIDILLTAVSFIASYTICSEFFPGIAKHRLVIQMPIIIAISSLIFLSIGIYRGLVNYNRLRQVYSIFNAICLANILTIVFAVVNGKLIMEEDLAIPLSIILVHSLLSFVALVASRYLYKNLLLNIKDKFVKTSNVVLVHNFDENSEEFKEYLSGVEDHRKKVVSKLNFLSESFDENLSHRDLEDNYVEGFILVNKGGQIPNFMNVIERLAKFKKPIYFGYSPFLSRNAAKDKIKLSKLDLAHLFSPQLHFQKHMGMVKNRTSASSILVTGAGGSIAKEYIRNLLDYGFKGKLILLENSEVALNAIYNYCQTFKNIDVISRLGDVKEQKLVQLIFEEHRPDYVLHAAGNTKPEFFDDNILNVMRENVLATKIVADISAKFMVKRFVFCSSVEAEQPRSTLEVCKRVSELYLDSLNTNTNPYNFISLRLNKVFNPENSFISYLKWQIDLGRNVDLSRFGTYKTFSNKSDVANALLHVTADSKPKGSVLVSKLGLKIKTSILVDLMSSLGLKDNYVENSGLDSIPAENDNGRFLDSFSGIIKNLFNAPPLEIVGETNTLSKSETQKVVETICLNILLNSKEYPEVFSLINDFGPGQWKDLHETYIKTRATKGVIQLGR